MNRIENHDDVEIGMKFEKRNTGECYEVLRRYELQDSWECLLLKEDETEDEEKETLHWHDIRYSIII